MSHSLTPREFASRNVAIVRQLWNGVRDGDVESIHQARIATRRIRAALSALGHADAEQLDVTKQLGRAFGRVRELDATEELLRTLGSRVPVAVPAIAVVLRDLQRDGARARRRLIKTLGDLDTRPLRRLHKPERLSSLKFWKDWRAELHADLASKTDSVRNAVDHASAVYMPNRLHRVRIALKKLRYALEIAEASGMHVNAKATRDARKLQDVLGRMRDLYLAGRLVERCSPLHKQFADETRVLMAVIAFERSALHSRYVSRRG